MDYEKAYKSLVDELRQAKNDERKGYTFGSVIDVIVPELAESKDEKIRKGLLEIFKNSQNGHWGGMEITDIVAYLEKQKEQKPAEWSEEDEIGLVDALDCVEKARKVAQNEGDMGNCWYAEKWLKSLKDRVLPQTKNEWSEEDNKMLATLLSMVNYASDHYQHDDKVTDVKAWLINAIHIKQRWTKDDECHLLNCLLLVRDALRQDHIKDRFYDDYKWLESLKERI